MQKLNFENGIFKKFDSSVRNMGKKILLSSVLGGFCLTGLSCSFDAQKKIKQSSSKKINETKQVIEKKELKNTSNEYAPNFIGSLYGEAGSLGGIFNSNPSMLNILAGYNIEKKGERELEKGVLLFPSASFRIKGDRAENPYNNHIDFGLGATYIKSPFIISAEGVHREPFKKENVDEQFFRLWGGYWDAYDLKESIEEMRPLNESQDAIWGTIYSGVDYNTLEKNAAADFRIDANLDLLNLYGLIIGPFAKAKVNYDVEDEPWYRYREVGAGIRLRKGPFNVFFEIGERDSFNKGGAEGSYKAVYGGVWYPIRF